MYNPYDRDVGTIEEDMKDLGVDPKSTIAALKGALNLPEHGSYVPDASGKKVCEGHGEMDSFDRSILDETAMGLGEDLDELGDERDDEEDVDEAVKIVKIKPRRGAKAKQQRRKARKLYKKNRAKLKRARKKKRKTAQFKRREKIRKRVKAKKGPLGKRRKLVVTGMDTVSNLSEQIDGIVQSVQPVQPDVEIDPTVLEYIESMDLTALIADALSDRFLAAKGEENAEENALAMEKLADAALDAAEKMESGELKGSEAEGRVRGILGVIASAMEEYGDLEDDLEGDLDDDAGDDAGEEAGEGN